MLSWIAWLLRILVACRVSVISTGAGFLLFAFVPQARDLFADVSFGALPYSPYAWFRWLAFFLYLFFFWAFPVHYAARRMLDDKDWVAPARLSELDSDCVTKLEEEGEKQHERMIRLVPRLLGLAPFAAVAIGLWKAYWVVGDVDGLETAFDAKVQIFFLTGLDLVVGYLFYRFVRSRGDILDVIVSTFAARRGKELSEEFRNQIYLFLANFCLIVTVLIYLAAYTWPFVLAAAAPRAMVVPFLFGSLVLFAGWLARMAEKTGVPWLGFAIAGALIVTAMNKHFNDMRILPANDETLAERQIDVDEAIDRWKAANHCENDKCPPALIVSAEGGASRAAFSLATAVGYILDRADALPDARPGASPARRIFAISGVSGGAFGAATVRTALWEAALNNSATPPCRKASEDWFHADKNQVTKSWRACLQALVVGDYLTPAFVGLGFRDNVAPPLPFIDDDRAVLVEKAWEEHFARVLALDPKGGDQTGLRRRFGYVRDMLTEGRWLPLLLLNGTSVNTGTRIIASDLISTRKSEAKGDQEPGRTPLYPAAYDLFEMLSKTCGGAGDVICKAAEDGAKDQPKIRNGADVRISSAALNSARFPIVSPAGIIRSKSNDNIGDRVVDGGYFENAGLTTSMDIARALHARHLTPIVLWVQNDPTLGACDTIDDSIPDGLPPRAAGTPHLKSADPQGLETVFGTLATPFNALVATRAGHSDEEAQTAQRMLQELADNSTLTKEEISSSYFTFRLYRDPRFDKGQCDKQYTFDDKELDRECAPLAGKKPKMDEVSMSWWLSQPVQASVDSQLCDWRNRKDLGNLRQRLSQMLHAKDPGASH